MITHANIMATMRSLTSLIELRPDDRFLSFLPLSHITERSVSHFGQIAAGGETWFARSFATVAEDLRACRPTLFFGVPRVWEKFRQGVLERVDEQPTCCVLASRYLNASGRGQDAAAGSVLGWRWRSTPRSTPSWAGSSVGSSASIGPGCWPAGLPRSTLSSCAGSMASGCPSPRGTA